MLSGAKRIHDDTATVCVGFGLKTNNRAYSWDFYLGSFGFELVDRPTAKVTS